MLFFNNTYMLRMACCSHHPTKHNQEVLLPKPNRGLILTKL